MENALDHYVMPPYSGIEKAANDNYIERKISGTGGKERTKTTNIGDAVASAAMMGVSGTFFIVMTAGFLSAALACNAISHGARLSAEYYRLMKRYVASQKKSKDLM